MPVSAIRGVNINWQVIGTAGPWVAMTTGGRRGHDEFIPLAHKIAAYGYRVMLHDRRNTGASDVLTRWQDIFMAGAHHSVMGVTEDELRSIKVPTLVIPGNDKVHSSASGLTAHRLVPGSTLHRLPIEDQDLPLIPFPAWAAHEAEIARVFADFMAHAGAAEHNRR
jgi:pimeloyl-ACP methyl ester carboxylesterase